MERHKRNFLYWTMAIVALVIFVHNAWHYVEIRYAEDDAFVSMVYARRLLEGHGLTWTDSVRVEGYSNFLWTMAQAGFGAFGVDLFVSSRVLGFLGMGLVFLSSIVVFHPTRSKSIFVSSFVLFALALSQPFAIWTCGGLEVSFVVGFLSIALAIVLPTLEHGLTNRRMWLAGIPFGLLCLTRPDGPLFVAATAGALIALNKFDRRAMAKTFFLSSSRVCATSGYSASVSGITENGSQIPP